MTSENESDKDEIPATKMGSNLPEEQKTVITTPGEMADVDPLIGRRIGSIEISALLGEGAFGKVYRGHDTALSRDVAVKFLKGGLDQHRRALFAREAKAIAALSQHPHIVTIQ